MWISSGEYERLNSALDHERRRADAAVEALAEERAANREAERWWANMLLRAKQSYPMPAKSIPQPVDSPPLEPTGEVPGMDQGEIEAVVARGAEYGVGRAETIRLLRQERGL